MDPTLQSTAQSPSAAQPCDVVFPVAGRMIRSDHTYLLFAAIAGVEPRIRQCIGFGVDRLLGTIPLNGGYVGITSNTKLRLRVQPADIPLVLPLAGKPLRIADVTIRPGAAQIFQLRPASDLTSRFITIKGFKDPTSLSAAAKRQLNALGISRAPIIGHRSTIAVRGQRIVGFSMLVCDLSPSESLSLQAVGIGGRRRLGAGLFVPAPVGLRAQFEIADERDEPRAPSP